MSAAGIAAVNWVEKTNVVVRFDPFQRTTEPATKLVPLTVSVKAAPPAVADAGLRLVVVGAGLLIVKVRALEVPPPGAGLNTVTWARPCRRNVRCRNGRCQLGRGNKRRRAVRPVPAHHRAGDEIGSIDCQSEGRPSGVAVAGLRLVMIGAWALLIVKVWALDVPPPGGRTPSPGLFQPWRCLPPVSPPSTGSKKQMSLRGPPRSSGPASRRRNWCH